MRQFHSYALLWALGWPVALSHSWIEQMMVIDSKGSFTGTPGYSRNNTPRGSPGFSDPVMVHILPTDGQPTIETRNIGAVDTMSIEPTDSMCKKTQQQQYQSSGNPRLSAAPGSMIALRYQENGHVTLPQNQPGKPPNRGSVYIYGTTQPKADERFLDIFNKWNAAGTGGDKRGRLLATQNFDDGHCYQVNSGQISGTRQQQYPHTANQLMGADLWCQNDIKLPSDLPDGKPYTLYWVWDWPTEPGVDPNLPKGKAEVYTTCMDVDIKGSGPKQARSLHKARDMTPQDRNNAAIPAYVSQMDTPPAAASPPAPQATVGGAITAPLAGKPENKAVQQQAPAASPVNSVYVQEAASIIQEEIVSDLASMIAANGPTVAQPTATVYVTAPASPAPSAHQEKAKAESTPPAMTTTVTSYSTTVTVHAASSAPGMPPPLSSLSIKAPEGLFSGTASPASPASTAAAMMPRTCSNCRKVKRSRILGSV